ncbi:ATP synthase F1 subunit epsilon [Cephaloticoccus primus]|uniref:ATP synthase epsilon chain n=1 Tax=Cephaloticoccus primus TaxID=1548207 RepID=A0A139SHX6_9BACT|nr:ATP synthase F1 subunit epsilon [Cephaloticoccus primus]KXU34133.1 ATP synthase F1 subunit epsilon [Cephaloticoccus primus]
MSLTLEIVTPEARVYSDTVDAVVIPTVEGEIGILPGHIPLLTQVANGELVATRTGSGGSQYLAVGGGFAQISGDKVSVLAEHACSEDAIDERAVEEALKRAQQQIEESKNLDPQQYEHLQNLVSYSGVQLALKRRSR